MAELQKHELRLDNWQYSGDYCATDAYVSKIRFWLRVRMGFWVLYWILNVGLVLASPIAFLVGLQVGFIPIYLTEKKVKRWIGEYWA